MAEKRRRGLLVRLMPWLLAFALGFGAGFYVNERMHAGEVRQAVEQARRDAVDAGLRAIERGRRAGEGLGAGARVATDSAKAALRELAGDTTDGDE